MPQSWINSFMSMDQSNMGDWRTIMLDKPNTQQNNQVTCDIHSPDTQTTDDETDECHEAFSLFDKNGDGFISTKELVTVLRSLGQDPSEDYINNIIRDYDTDGDGKIAFDEFLAVVEKLRNEKDSEEELAEIFNVIDVNGDGEISKSDLRQVAHKLRSTLLTRQLDEMIDEFDKDGDGTIDFDEFKKIIASTG